MPDFGAPVAQGVTGPDIGKTVNTLSGLMNLRLQGQQLQTGAAGIQAAQAQAQAAQQAMATRQKVQQWSQNGTDDWGNSLYLPGTKELDAGAFGTAITKFDGVNGPAIGQQMIKMNNDRIAMHSAMLGLTLKQREAVMGPMQAYALNPDSDHLDAANASLDSMTQQNPDMAPIADSAKRLMTIAGQNPDKDSRKRMANTFSANYQPGQPVQTQPKSSDMNTGGNVLSGTTAPPAAGGGFSPTTSTPITLSPGERTKVNISPITGQPFATVLNPSGVGASITGVGINESKSAVGEVDDNAGNVKDQRKGDMFPSPAEEKAVSNHYTNLVAEANKASQDIGVLQNIKKYAGGAVTGVATDRRAYIAGLAGLLGMTPEQMAKTNTDLLMKNEKMLALAGGNTNLAKTMAESANPNVHMTPQAIKSAANQVIAQRELPLEQMHYFSQFTKNYGSYNKELAEWNQHADPRVLQLPHMSKQERADMASSMSEQERNDFAAHVRYFQSKGMLK